MNNSTKVILFTKAPSLGYGKSRLKDFISEENRLDLCIKMINNSFNIIDNEKYKTEIYYEGNIDDLYFIDAVKVKQKGKNLGEKMYNAFVESLKDFDNVIITGSDVMGISKEIIDDTIEKLSKVDVVIYPTIDGGYGLIAMRNPNDVFSGITYSTDTVFNETIKKIKLSGLKFYIGSMLYDIDESIDLVRAETGTENIKLLGSGEYNINYLVNDDYVLRINMKSQLNLNNQIEYEYNALKMLEKSAVTPKVFDIVLEPEYIYHPYLTMEYLKGDPLDYNKDLNTAAHLLANIHNCDFKEGILIYAKKPFKNMYDESIRMFNIYKTYNFKDRKTEELIEKMLDSVTEVELNRDITSPCIINTELNNKNFVISDNKSYVIDWEKPIIGEGEQDIAHFLIPTTTAWKTSKILSETEIEYFINEYEKYRKINRSKLSVYIKFNIIRAITWCAMAKVEYETERIISNSDTYEKLNEFLNPEFLSELYNKFFIRDFNYEK